MKRSLPYDNEGETASVIPFVIPLGGLRFEVPVLQRIFDFGFLRDTFSDFVCQRIAKCLCENFAKYTRRTAITRFGYFKRFILHTSALQTVAVKIRDGGKRSLYNVTSELNTALQHWGQSEKNHYQGRMTTFGEIVNGLNACLHCLESQAVFPRLSRIKLPKNYHHGKKRRPSLAELGHGALPSNSIFVELQQKIQKLDPTVTDDEIRGFLAGLAQDTQLTGSESGEMLADSMHRLTVNLLETIRKISEEKLLFWSKVYEEGQQLLLCADSQAVAMFDNYIKAKGVARRVISVKLFPKNNVEKSKANFLRICVERFSGLVPPAAIFRTSTYAALMERFGGKYQIAAMLNAHTDAVAAAVLIYLVDSGANLSVTLALTPNSESKAEEKGYFTYDSLKAKAGYKPIITLLPEVDGSRKLSAVQALRLIKIMTSKAREAEPRLANTLFIHCFFSKPNAANDDLIRNRLEYFLRDSGQLALALKPGAIRVSYLLRHTLEGEGNTLIAQILADHSAGTGVTETYALRWPVRERYVQLIRHFTDVLEKQMIFGVQNPKNNFGSAAAQDSESVHRITRTGVGLSCMDPFAGARPGTTDGRECTKAGECPGCDMKIVMVNKENLIDALLVQHSIKSRATELESQRPARWELFYLPQLAFVDVLIEKVGKSRYAHLLKVARVEAELLLKNGVNLVI